MSKGEHLCEFVGMHGVTLCSRERLSRGRPSVRGTHFWRMMCFILKSNT